MTIEEIRARLAMYDPRVELTGLTSESQRPRLFTVADLLAALPVPSVTVTEPDKHGTPVIKPSLQAGRR